MPVEPLAARVNAVSDRLLEVRPFNLMAAAVCVVLLSYAYYSQFVLGLEPCPLCIFQRIAMIALLLVFLVAAALGGGPLRSRIMAGLLGATAVSGAGISAWHIRQQHLPGDEWAACGADLGYMIEVFSFWETLQMAFTGTGDCAEVDWAFLGLSMPAWVGIFFLLLGSAGVWANWRAARPPF